MELRVGGKFVCENKVQIFFFPIRAHIIGSYWCRSLLKFVAWLKAFSKNPSLSKKKYLTSGPHCMGISAIVLDQLLMEKETFALWNINDGHMFAGCIVAPHRKLAFPELHLIATTIILSHSPTNYHRWFAVSNWFDVITSHCLNWRICIMYRLPNGILVLRVHHPHYIPFRGHFLHMQS